MIVLSNLTAQTLQPGQAVTFNNVITESNCGRNVCYNKQAPQSVKLCKRGPYEVHFSGNVTGTTANAALQLAIALGGQALSETAMNSTPAAAGSLNNVHTTTVVRNCCCDLDRLSVINTGAVPVTLAPNSAFVIHKLCD